MSSKAKEGLWWAMERLGLPTVFCVVLWYGFRTDAQAAREATAKITDRLLLNSERVASTIAENSEVMRQIAVRQAEMERVIAGHTRAVERQTDFFERFAEVRAGGNP